jgi:hypothetical protein
LAIEHACFYKIFDGETDCFRGFATLDLEIEPLKVRICVGVGSHKKLVLQKSSSNDQLQITALKVCHELELHIWHRNLMAVCTEDNVLRFVRGDRVGPLSCGNLPGYLPIFLCLESGFPFDFRPDEERFIVEVNEFHSLTAIKAFLILHYLYCKTSAVKLQGF